MLQFMKAGIIELPDIFLVNKADLGAAAERTASELQAGLGLGERDPGGWEAPVLVASARDGVGIEALVEAIEGHRAHLAASDALGRARAEGRESFLLESLERRYGSYGLECVGGRDGVLVRARKPSGRSIFGLVLEIGSEIEARLGASQAS
jgi:LAO/AO transport system kinase